MATPEKIRALAHMVEQIEKVNAMAVTALPNHEWEAVFAQLYEVSQTLRDRLVTYLAYTDDMLVGAELRNECSELKGTVVRVEREPDLMIITDNDCLYPHDLGCDRYFCLPGSNAYGELGLAELARDRAEQAERQRPPVPV